MNLCDKPTWEALTFLVSQETQEKFIDYLCTAWGVIKEEPEVPEPEPEVPENENVSDGFADESVVNESLGQSQDYLEHLQDYLREYWIEVTAVTVAVTVLLLFIGIWLIRRKRLYV